MYIGKTPALGNYQKCDAITTSATATYNLLVGSVAVSPETANNCIVSLNGVIQAPTDAYTISGSQIIFNSALTSADVIDFILILGDVLDIGTPSDSTVSLAKLTATGSASASTFLRGDNAWAAAGGGKIGQVVQTVNTGTETLSSTTPTTISDFTVAITPAATSSKVLVFTSGMFSTTASDTMSIQMFRDTTQIFMGDAASNRSRTTMGVHIHNTRSSGTFAACYLDSPSSTSEVAYSCKWFSQGSTPVYMNRTSADNDTVAYDNRTASSITAMEILV